jgi:transcription elongation factor Elf1
MAKMNWRKAQLHGRRTLDARAEFEVSPAVIKCPRCGHRATTTRARGRAALSASDLAGKTLVCTKCGARQRLDLADVIESIYREGRPR